MKCNYCGAEIADDSVKCPYCEKEVEGDDGRKNAFVAEENRTQFNGFRSSAGFGKQSMNYDIGNFSRIFSIVLLLNAVLSVLSALKIFGGRIYGDVPAAEVYAHFGNSLKYTQYLYGGMCIVIALLCVYAAMCVKKETPNAYKLVIAVYAIGIIADLVYGGLCWKIMGVNVIFNVRFFLSILFRCALGYGYVFTIKQIGEQNKNKL